MRKLNLSCGRHGAVRPALLLVCAAVTGCWDWNSSGNDDGPRPSGIGAQSSAVVATAATPKFVNRLELAGDTVALFGTDSFNDAWSLHVTSVNPAFGDSPPLRSLDIERGLGSLRVSDRFVVRIDMRTSPTDFKELHIFDVQDLDDATATGAEWSPVDGSLLDILRFDHSDTWIAWIGPLDEVGAVPPRLGLTDLADDLGRNPIDLGPATGSQIEVAISDRMLVWHDDPYVFDVDRPVVPNENPRNLGRRQLRDLSAGHVMFSNFSGDIFYVVDGTDPDAMTEHFYSRAVVEDHAPQMDGPFIAQSICENLELLQGVLTSFYVCADEPDVSVHVLDLNAPRVAGENPRIVATAQGDIRAMASGPLGVAWRSGSERDETLSYWNPDEPLIDSVNPLAIYAGWPNAESADLESVGLLFFTEARNEVRQIRFINVIELVLATHENS